MSDASLDRRSLLAGTAALLTAAVLARPAGADEDEDDAPRRVRKAVKFDMVRVQGSVAAKFGLVKACGFDGIELASPSTLDPDEVLRARDGVGLPIHGVVDSVHWRDRLTDKDSARRAAGRQGLETALRDARRYGASTVLLVPGVVDADTGYDEAWERSTEEIRKVLPLAEELRVQIAIENVWNHFLLSPLEAARYVDQFESAWIGWYLDVGNVWSFGWPAHWIRILGKRILKVDVKGYSRARRDAEGPWKGFGVEIDEGDLDWAAARAALHEIGYEGWATAEVGGGDETRLREIGRRMDAVLGLPR